MTEITALLDALSPDDPATAAQLLPLVDDDLRRLAAHRLAHDAPGQTFEPTALVQEAYLRLLGTRAEERWDSRGHFSAVAQAMRRILVENARRTHRLQRDGDKARQPLEEAELLAPEPHADVLALDEALTELVVNRVGNDYSVHNMS